MTKKPEPKLLSGGNPQIPLGYGEGPVRDYLDAIPGWKREVAEWVDALVTRTVPGVEKAVKWNSPLYGMGGGAWFMSFHCFDRYLKVAFHKGARLDPPPPVASKSGETRYVHLHEGEPRDEARFASWIRQASELPGEKM